MKNKIKYCRCGESHNTIKQKDKNEFIIACAWACFDDGYLFCALVLLSRFHQGFIETDQSLNL